MRAVAVAVLLFSAAAAAAPDAAGAETFLRSIYEQYLAKDSKGVALERRDLKRWFTPSLAALIQRDRDHAARRHEVGALDGDPFIDAQDWELSDLHLAAVPSPTGAQGRVSFVNAGTKVSITLDLVPVKASWRIADIHWPDGSLVELLTKAR